jgi:hypothetical protein
MKCTNCGVNIGNESQFCPYCGQTVQTTPDNEVTLNTEFNSQNQNEFSNGAFPAAPVAPDVGPIVLPVLEGGISNNPLFQSTQFNVASPTPNADSQTDSTTASDFDNSNATATTMEQDTIDSQEQTPVVENVSQEAPVVANKSKNHTTLIIVIIVMLLCGIAFIGFTIFTNWK